VVSALKTDSVPQAYSTTGRGPHPARELLPTGPTMVFILCQFFPVISSDLHFVYSQDHNSVA